MKIRNERFFQVPLCAIDCDQWFAACKDDYTCNEDWVNSWLWTSEGNKCKDLQKCRTFQDVFGTAKDFCEKVCSHPHVKISVNENSDP